MAGWRVHVAGGFGAVRCGAGGQLVPRAGLVGTIEPERPHRDPPYGRGSPDSPPVPPEIARDPMTPTVATLARLVAPVADARRFTAGVALVFGIAAVGLLAVPPTAMAWDSGEYSAASESQLISMQNQARASAGRRSLKLDTALRTIARWRSKDMVKRDYFSHTIKGTSRSVFWYMQHEYGYCFKLAGENIGTVTWKGASVEDATNWVFNAFMDSKGHRDNIMGKAWDVVAVGAYKGAGDTFMWTVLFADKCGSSSPSATPKPTPRPTAKPKPKPAPTAKPKPAATPKPTAKPKPKPAATAEPLPSWTPFVFLPPTPGPTSSPTETPVSIAEPGGTIGVAPPGQLRVIDAPAELGLVDSILESVTARFFGQ